MILRYKWYFSFLFFVQSIALYGQPPCSGTLSSNALENGDFGTGPPAVLQEDPGLAPGYQYQNEPPPQDGYYTVGSTTDFGDDSFPCWVITGDNSDDPDGYMMIVNADFNPGTFYENTVSVCENTNYVFQVDIINLIRTVCVGNIEPNIDFLLDGEVFYQTGQIPQDETWTTYGFEFTTQPGQTEITLSLKNNAPGGAGNDLALDNIGFFHCGPIVEISQEETVCAGGAVALTAELSELNYDNPILLWQISTDGGATWTNIEDSNNTSLIIEEANSAATYRVLVANTNENLNEDDCRTTSEPFTLLVQDAPQVEIFEVFCENSTFEIGDTSIFDPGTYQITLKDDDGCDSLLILELEGLPAYLDTIDILICEGESFEGILIDSDTLIVRSFTTADGCDSILNYDIKIFDLDSNLIIGDTMVCQGQTTVLAVAPGFDTYIWSTGENTPMIEVGPGSYTLEITTADGCMLSDEITIREVNIVLNWSVDHQSCPDIGDGVIELSEVEGGTPPFSMTVDGIRFNEIPAIWSGLIPGSYLLTVEDSEGCTQEVDIDILPADPIIAEISLSAANNVSPGQPINVSVNTNVSIASITWLPGNGEVDCVDCQSTVWRPDPAGLISAEIFTDNNCRVLIDTALNITFNYDVYFPNAFSPNDDNINDVYFPGVTSSVQMIQTLIIFDRWGQEIYRIEQIRPDQSELGWDGLIQGVRAEPGVYVFYAEVLFVNDELLPFSGGFTLVR